MSRSIIPALLALAIFAPSGCGRRERVVVYEERPVHVHEHEYDYDDDDYDDVIIETRHVCTEYDCLNHYYDGRRVVVLRSHRHSANCGHIFNGRYWVRGPRRVVRTGHVCSRDCHHHYWDGARLIDLRGHRHGPGCGHVWSGSYWVVSRPAVVAPHGGRRVIRTGHVCTRDCHHHYWDGARLIEVRGHRHGPGCGHSWSGKYWIVARQAAPIPRGGRRVIRVR